LHTVCLSIIRDSGGKSNHRDTETCQHEIKGKLPPIPSSRRFLLDKSWTGGNKQITDRHLLKNWQVVVQIALLTEKKAGQTAPIFAFIQRFFGIAGLC